MKVLIVGASGMLAKPYYCQKVFPEIKKMFR